MEIISANISLTDEGLSGMNPRPDPNPAYSNITVFYQNGNKVTLTEEFLTHCLEMIEYDRTRWHTNRLHPLEEVR